jgi:hypothetical protein
VDVDRMLDCVGARAKADGYPNIETLPSKYDGPVAR